VNRARPFLRALILLGGLPCALPAQDTAQPSLPLSYYGTDLELDQPAWNDPGAHIGEGQHAPGHRICRRTESICRARLRYSFVTALRLDPSERIARATISDTTSFEAATFPHGPNNIIELRPLAAGVDATLHIYTHEGTLYPVHLTAKTHLEPTVTDVIIDLESRKPGTLHPAPARPAPAPASPTPADPPSAATGTPAQHAALQSRQLAALAGSSTHKGGIWGDYGNLQIDGFDPAQLVYDVEAWASTAEAARIIGPTRVFRDQHWTYIDYSNKLEVRQRWPVALLLTDGTESPIPYRIAGPNGEILIIEAIGDIVLRSGQLVICLRLKRSPSPASPTFLTASPQPDTVLPPVPTVIAPEADSPRADLVINIDDTVTDAERTALQRILQEEAPYATPTNGTLRQIATLHAQRACTRIARLGLHCTIRNVTRP